MRAVVIYNQTRMHSSLLRVARRVRARRMRNAAGGGFPLFEELALENEASGWSRIDDRHPTQGSATPRQLRFLAPSSTQRVRSLLRKTAFDCVQLRRRAGNLREALDQMLAPESGVSTSSTTWASS